MSIAWWHRFSAPTGNPGGLHPPVAAHHRGRDGHWLAEHRQVPAADLPRPGGGQRRPAAGPRLPPGRPGQVRHPDGDHARLPEQPQAGILARSEGDIQRPGASRRAAAGHPAGAGPLTGGTAGMSEWLGNEAPWLVWIIDNPHC